MMMMMDEEEEWRGWEDGGHGDGHGDGHGNNCDGHGNNCDGHGDGEVLSLSLSWFMLLLFHPIIAQQVCSMFSSGNEVEKIADEVRGRISGGLSPVKMAGSHIQVTSVGHQRRRQQW